MTVESQLLNQKRTLLPIPFWPGHLYSQLDGRGSREAQTDQAPGLMIVRHADLARR